MDQRPDPAGALDRRIQHIGAHHHARAAAERGVIDRAVFIAREIADVHRFEPPDPGLERLAGQRIGERPGQHLGKDRQHGGEPGHRASTSFSSFPRKREFRAAWAGAVAPGPPLPRG